MVMNTQTSKATLMGEKSRRAGFLGQLARLSFIAVGAAVLANCPFYVVSLSKYFSHVDVYRQLALGMPRAEAVEILRKNHLSCGLAYSKEAPPLECEFGDFWRVYRIGFSPEPNSRLEVKQFFFIHRSSSLGWLIHRHWGLFENSPQESVG